MQMRRLGRGGPDISVVGFGSWEAGGLHWGPNSSEQDVIAAIHAGLDAGMTWVDTAEVYGDGVSERIVGRAVAGRDDVLVFTKVAPDEGSGLAPDQVRGAIDASLQRLGRDHVDLYQVHWPSDDVPIEETWGAMAELVAAGKVRHLGLSEAAPETIRRAHAVHPISALQTEYSLWSRDPEEEILPTVRELGIGFVPYSPLGRGFLTGRFARTDDLADDDFRRSHPRFQGENLERNLQLVERVRAIAEEKGVAPGQLALAWVLAQGDDVVPIPGTKRVQYLEQNAGAADVELTEDDLRRLDEAAPRGAAAGERYADMSSIDT
jgi:aryl-alcohol dehydrogenase-like predicted oxidoreductase